MCQGEEEEEEEEGEETVHYKQGELFRQNTRNPNTIGAAFSLGPQRVSSKERPPSSPLQGSHIHSPVPKRRSGHRRASRGESVPELTAGAETSPCK